MKLLWAVSSLRNTRHRRSFLRNEAHSELNSSVNKQNMDYKSWFKSTSNSEKIFTCYCLVHNLSKANQPIIYILFLFFEDGDGCTVTVSAERYVNNLKIFLFRITLKMGCNEEEWFQQDAAIPHGKNVVLKILKSEIWLVCNFLLDDSCIAAQVPEYNSLWIFCGGMWIVRSPHTCIRYRLIFSKSKII